MPELPEVQTVVDTLRRALAEGRTVQVVSHLRQDMLHRCDADFPQKLAGRSIDDVSRRGKRIILRLDDGNRFYVHLGMTGRLTVDLPAASPRPHTHLVVRLLDGREIRFVDPRRFGAIVWLGADQADDSRLGPEPLSIRVADLAGRLARTRRAVKSALLDQRLIAGIGNIYADEALFAAGIHPSARANRLTDDQVQILVRAIKQVLRRAIRHGGSTLRDYVDANGAGGRFQLLHRVYDRQGEPCARCGAAIRRFVLGGRSTHFCPSCQKRRSQAAFSTS